MTLKVVAEVVSCVGVLSINCSEPVYIHIVQLQSSSATIFSKQKQKYGQVDLRSSRPAWLYKPGGGPGTDQLNTKEQDLNINSWRS